MISLNPVVNVFYFVEDLEAATEWYGQLLGRDPSETRPQQLASFTIGSARLTLHAQDDYNANAGTRGTVAYWDVADVDAAVADCIGRGAVAHRGPVTIFTGERLCQVRDPFGNLLGLRQAPAMRSAS
jgi:predicted enzyme related to lactoylglutathione lyase